ncbi:ABC-F family ATP-binding cassette domain-containing protein [Shinella pollutisoli]|uniref:ABC-F family ATP-binding cassette domain-containing protein n=1 Tax=Shinella pollutisoli TaxID=2250594 RepID=A0ABV7DBJ7_9HYPH|nr:ABC-F family ATP-binding cassette domain-containing protein [Shinella pollutisoli]
MAPPILKLDDITLSFGGTPLLAGAGLQVEPGDRISLVGRNGSGKSTLMKIAAGLVEPQSGEVFRHPSATIRYLHQAPDFDGFDTVAAYAEAGLGPGDDPYRVTYLLEHLGLTGAEDPASLSGGEARRAALARVLAPEPDILLLDEPTNHLDLPTIEWLEGELQSTRSALVVISHDRRFLEKVSNATVWLDRGQSRRLNRGFGHFEAWRDEVLEAEELEQHKLGKAIEREEHWLRYGVTARRKRNMRRLGQLHEMRARHRGHRGPQGSVQAGVSEAQESGKLVIEAERVAKSFGGRVIVAPFSIRVHRGDCIGLVGPNGAGKTTLLKLLTGQLEPDGGTVKLGTNLEIATLDQRREDLNLDDTLAHYLTDGRGETLLVNGEQRHVTGYMKEFLFQPEQARTPIRNLSGGERARLMLARILSRPVNLLILDEPTNDLDIETLDLLQEIVSGFPGTVLLVSHDRDFLDRTVTSTIAPADPENPDGRWIEYAGGYTDMMAQRRGAIEEKRRTEKAERTKPAAAQPAEGKAKGKLSYKQKFALENLPKEMEKTQKEIAAREERMADPALFSKDPAAFNRLAAELETLRAGLSRMEEEWLELEMLREELEG